MKKTVLFLLVLVVVALAYQLSVRTGSFADDAAQSVKADGASPETVVPAPDFNFGEVLEGEIVTHEYVIENKGTAPLKILEVRTSCGCTTARKPESVVPGTQEQIVVQGNTRGYGGRDFNKTITVTTDDPKQPRIQLHLSGKVMQFASIQPGHLFLRGNAGDPLQAEAIITPSPAHRFKIVKTTTDSRLADKIAVTVTESDGAYHVTVRNLLTAPASYGGNILFTTDNTLRPKLKLYVRGRIEGKKVGG